MLVNLPELPKSYSLSLSLVFHYLNCQCYFVLNFVLQNNALDRDPDYITDRLVKYFNHTISVDSPNSFGFGFYPIIHILLF